MSKTTHNGFISPAKKVILASVAPIALALMFTLILVLSWTTAAYAQYDTPFDAQYELLGIRSDSVDHGQNSGQSSLTSTVVGQEAKSPILGLLPETGGAQLWLLILGSSAIFFSSALLMQHVRNRRR
jgi:hypothetical protein